MHLRIDWINVGKTRKFCIILIFVPGVEVKSIMLRNLHSIEVVGIITKKKKKCYFGLINKPLIDVVL